MNYEYYKKAWIWQKFLLNVISSWKRNFFIKKEKFYLMLVKYKFHNIVLFLSKIKSLLKSIEDQALFTTKTILQKTNF